MILFLTLGCTGPTDTAAGETGAVDSGDTAGPLDTADTADPVYAVPEHPYLLTFHTCAVDDPCGNPLNHTVQLAGSDDGASWTVLDWFEPYVSSVPDVIVRDGILYVYALPELRRVDLETYEALSMANVMFQSDEQVFHADPSMIIDDDGSLVMFFLEGAKDTDPSGCEETPCTKRILSATEVAGSQGTEFVVDPGSRVEITIEEDGPSHVSDPDIFVGPDGYVLLISRGQSVRVYASDTLRGEYVPVSNDNLTPGTGGVPSGDYIDGAYWLYASVDAQGGGDSEVQWTTLSDITQPLANDALSPVTFTPDFGDDLLTASPGFWSVEQP